MSGRKNKNVRNLSKINVNSSLISAVIEGDLESVKNLVRSHCLSNCNGNEGYVLLMVATKLRHIDIATILLQEGAKADCGTDNVSTPLHLAVKQGCPKLVQLLLEKKVVVSPRNTQNETPLHFAAKEGDVEIVDALLNNNADVTAQTSEGLTPLFLAIEGRHSKVFQMLCNHACTNLKVSTVTRNSTLLNRILLCNPSIHNKVNELVVSIVTNDYGQSIIVDELIDLGFSLNCECVNESLLIAAVKKNYVKLIDSILRNNRNRNNSKYDFLLLHSAVRYGHKEIAELFLNAGFNVNARDAMGKTCLCYSMHCENDGRYVEMIQLLLANGAVIKEAPELLHTAVAKELFEVCKLLIENGADLNVRKQGVTPLYQAVSKKQTYYPPRQNQGDKEQNDQTSRDKVIEILLNRGADVNISKQELTAFHHAVLSGRAKTVSIFIESGVDVDLRAKNATTPLFLASSKGYIEIVEVLCQNNANVNICRGRVSPLCVAVRKGKTKIVKMLLKFGALINFVFDNVLWDYDFHNNPDSLETILSNHLVKLKAAGFYVKKQSANSDPVFEQKCLEEIIQLQKEELSPQFTLLDVLVDGQNPIYAMNKSLMETFKSLSLDAFPIYEDLIRNNIRRSQYRLELVRSGLEWLDILIKTSNKINGWKYSFLPVEILEQIVLCLKNSEIKSLSSCGKALKQQLSQ